MRNVGFFFLIGAVGFAVAAAQVPFMGLGFGIAAGTFAVVGVVFFLWGRNMAKSQANAQRIWATGLDARVTLVGLEDTGVTINDNPRVRLRLNVQVAGRPVYEVTRTETIGRLMIGHFVTGKPYAAKVDPADPQQVVVDWQGQASRGPVESADALLQRGLPAQATIADTFNIDMTTPEGDPIVGYVLNVSVQDGRPPYQVRVGHRTPRHLAGESLKGRVVAVAVDPATPQKVAIDWSRGVR